MARSSHVKHCRQWGPKKATVTSTSSWRNGLVDLSVRSAVPAEPRLLRGHVYRPPAPRWFRAPRQHAFEFTIALVACRRSTVTSSPCKVTSRAAGRRLMVADAGANAGNDRRLRQALAWASCLTQMAGECVSKVRLNNAVCGACWRHGAVRRRSAPSDRSVPRRRTRPPSCGGASCGGWRCSSQCPSAR